jgi:hypothetical protein
VGPRVKLRRPVEASEGLYQTLTLPHGTTVRKTNPATVKKDSLCRPT